MGSTDDAVEAERLQEAEDKFLLDVESASARGVAKALAAEETWTAALGALRSATEKQAGKFFLPRLGSLAVFLLVALGLYLLGGLDAAVRFLKTGRF